MLTSLAHCMQFQNLKAGEILGLEGTPCYTLYIIVGGEVERRKGHSVEILTTGESLGTFNPKK